jgi:hypothetical protein
MAFSLPSRLFHKLVNDGTHAPKLVAEVVEAYSVYLCKGYVVINIKKSIVFVIDTRSLE